MIHAAPWHKRHAKRARRIDHEGSFRIPWVSFSSEEILRPVDAEVLEMEPSPRARSALIALAEHASDDATAAADVTRAEQLLQRGCALSDARRAELDNLIATGHVAEAGRLLLLGAEAEAEATCPLCMEPFGGADEFVACPRCGVRFHGHCLSQHLTGGGA